MNAANDFVRGLLVGLATFAAVQTAGCAVSCIEYGVYSISAIGGSDPEYPSGIDDGVVVIEESELIIRYDRDFEAEEYPYTDAAGRMSVEIRYRNPRFYE